MLPYVFQSQNLIFKRRVEELREEKSESLKNTQELVEQLLEAVTDQRLNEIRVKVTKKETTYEKVLLFEKKKLDETRQIIENIENEIETGQSEDNESII